MADNATRKKPSALKRKAQAEFRDWKKQLIQMIESGSRIDWSTDNTAYRFLIAPKIVKLVWQTTIMERVALAMREGHSADEAPRVAMEAVRGEVDAAVDQRLRARAATSQVAARALRAVPNEQEEAEAAAKLQQYREELIKSRESE